MSTLADAYETGYRDGLMAAINEVGSIRPRNAIVTVHHKRREFESIGCDGNTPNWRYFEEVEQVPAKVWPAAMSENELLVEWDDGTLGVAKLWDIRMGVMADG